VLEWIMAFILLAILVVLLLAALPIWRYSLGWGYYPSGLLAVLLMMVIALMIVGIFYAREPLDWVP
jgi:hypothetical protein